MTAFKTLDIVNVYAKLGKKGDKNFIIAGTIKLNGEVHLFDLSTNQDCTTLDLRKPHNEDWSTIYGRSQEVISAYIQGAYDVKTMLERQSR